MSLCLTALWSYLPEELSLSCRPRGSPPLGPTTAAAAALAATLAADTPPFSPPAADDGLSRFTEPRSGIFRHSQTHNIKDKIAISFHLFASTRHFFGLTPYIKGMEGCFTSLSRDVGNAHLSFTVTPDEFVTFLDNLGSFSSAEQAYCK